MREAAPFTSCIAGQIGATPVCNEWKRRNPTTASFDQGEDRRRDYLGTPADPCTGEAFATRSPSILLGGNSV